MNSLNFRVVLEKNIEQMREIASSLCSSQRRILPLSLRATERSEAIQVAQDKVQGAKVANPLSF
jgi:hypothetical protein